MHKQTSLPYYYHLELVLRLGDIIDKSNSLLYITYHE